MTDWKGNSEERRLWVRLWLDNLNLTAGTDASLERLIRRAQAHAMRTLIRQCGIVDRGGDLARLLNAYAEDIECGEVEP